MPYKNKEDQKRNSDNWYRNNKDRVLFLRKERRLKLKEWFKEYKEKLSCEICGENHSACIDFHHENRDEKEFNIPKMIHGGYSKKRILNEIEKCKVLCANCHRKEHNGQWFNKENSGLRE